MRNAMHTCEVGHLDGQDIPPQAAVELLVAFLASISVVHLLRHLLIASCNGQLIRVRVMKISEGVLI